MEVKCFFFFFLTIKACMSRQEQVKMFSSPPGLEDSELQELVEDWTQRMYTLVRTNVSVFITCYILLLMALWLLATGWQGPQHASLWWTSLRLQLAAMGNTNRVRKFPVVRISGDSHKWWESGWSWGLLWLSATNSGCHRSHFTPIQQLHLKKK